jgi:hypothetical protein
MLAIPAPATLPTNCRRDIVNGASPERYNRNALLLFYRLDDLSDGSRK